MLYAYGERFSISEVKVTICNLDNTPYRIMFCYFYVFILFSVCLMSASQPCTAANAQACTSILSCPSPNAGSSICSRCPGSSTQTAGYVCPDGNHCRWSGSGFCCGTHHWPCHDRSFQWRTIRACQAWRHLPGKIGHRLRTSFGQISVAAFWTVRTLDLAKSTWFIFDFI